MKKVLISIGKAFGAFFVSLLDDLKESFKKHWVGLIGRVFMFIVPLAFIVTTYIQRTPSKWALPTFAWIPLTVFLLVYWGKLRTYLAIKVSAMQVENNLQKGKHAGAIIIVKTIQVISTILPFFLCYRVFAAIEAEAMSVKNIFLFITVCEAVGGFFIVVDTIANVVDYSEEH